MAFWRRYIVMRDKRSAARGYVRLNMSGNTIEVFANCPLKQDKYVLLLFGKGFTQRLTMRMQGKYATAQGRVLLPRGERILAAVMGGQRMALMGESDGALSEWADAENEAFHRNRQKKATADKPVSTLRRHSAPIVADGSRQDGDNRPLPVSRHTGHDGATQRDDRAASGGHAQTEHGFEPEPADYYGVPQQQPGQDNIVYTRETGAARRDGLQPKPDADRLGELPGRPRTMPEIPINISMDLEHVEWVNKPRQWSWREDTLEATQPGKQPQQTKANTTESEGSRYEQPPEHNTSVEAADIMEHAPGGHGQAEPEHTQDAAGNAAMQPGDEEYIASDFAHPMMQHQLADEEASAAPYTAQTGEAAQAQEAADSAQDTSQSEDAEPGITEAYEAQDEQTGGIGLQEAEDGQAYPKMRIQPSFRGILAEPPALQGKYAGEWEWDTISVPGSGFTYLLGHVEDDGQTVAVAVAVAGDYAPSPPPNLSGFTGYTGGYWVLAQDAETGEQLAIG